MSLIHETVSFIFTKPSCPRNHLRPSTCSGSPNIFLCARAKFSRPHPAPLPTANHNLDGEIFSLAIPALATLALEPILSLIDTAFVGRIGVHALAAVAIATLVLNVSILLFHFLNVTVTPLVSQCLANNPNPNAASRLIATALQISFAIGVVVAVIFIPIALPVCRALGSTPITLPLAVTYLRPRLLAAPFILVSFAATGALRALRDLRTPLLVAILAALLDTALDAFLLLYLGLGVGAIAWATTTAQVFATSLLVLALVRTNRLYLPHLFNIPARHHVAPLLTAGAFLMVRTIALLATFSYATTVAAAAGVAALAAHELCRQLWLFNAMLLNSFTTAAQALVAPAMAAGERRRARRLANRCVQLAVMFGAALSVIHLAAGLRLPTLFTSSRNVAQIATNCIRIAAVCTPLNGAVFALDGVLSACCDFQYVSAAIAFASLLGCVALTVGRVLGGGASGVWASINLLMIARAVVLFWRYNSPRSPIPSLFTYSRKRIICADKKSGEENSASL